MIKNLAAFQNPNLDAMLNKGTWELSLGEQQLSWSDNQYRLYGYEPNELKLDDNYFIINTTHPSDINRISLLIKEALAKYTSYHFKRRIIKKDGSFGFVKTDALIKRNTSGTPVKITGTTTSVAGCTQQGIYDYNDPAFFNILYADYRKAIDTAISKLVFDKDQAQDLCQEIFLKAWQNMHRFDPGKGGLYTWLVSIAQNHCKDYLRSKHYRHSRMGQPYDHTAAGPGAEDKAFHNFHLNGLLLHLNTDQKELVDLIYVQGYTQTEIAGIKQMPLGTVKSKTRAIHKKLKQVVKKDE